MAAPPRTTINLDDRDRKELEALARAEERSVAAQARIAIRYYLDAIKRRSKATR